MHNGPVAGGIGADGHLQRDKRHRLGWAAGGRQARLGASGLAVRLGGRLLRRNATEWGCSGVEGQQLGGLNLGFNQLSGTLPADPAVWGALPHLRSLSMRSNALSGTLPTALRLLTLLEDLNLPYRYYRCIPLLGPASVTKSCRPKFGDMTKKMVVNQKKWLSY